VARPCEIFTRLPLKPEAFYDEKEHQSGFESIREFAEPDERQVSTERGEMSKMQFKFRIQDSGFKVQDSGFRIQI
jgi:hypothetical protein